MLTILELDADNVVAVGLDGKISTEQFDRVATLVEDKLQRHDKIRMYVEVISFGGMSIAAFFKDMKLALHHWKRFDKEAVVTDKKWLQKLSKMGGKLFPGIDVRAFPSMEAEMARQWVQAP